MKKKLLLIISSLSIILIFAIYGLSLRKEKTDITNNIEGNGIEAPEGFTFIEGLGLSFLTSGLSYQFGVSPDFVESGFKAIIETDFTMQETATASQALNWNEIYTKKEEITKDSNGKEIDKNDITITYMMPIGINENNIESTSNAWILNYRFYKNSLTGLKPSYWYSQLFQEDIYFNRAWNSLKWMCQDYLNCEILKNNENSIEAIFYADDIYWYLYLDKLYDVDIFNLNKSVNCISMKIDPIKEEDAVDILKKYNKIIQ